MILQEGAQELTAWMGSCGHAAQERCVCMGKLGNELITEKRKKKRRGTKFVLLVLADIFSVFLALFITAEVQPEPLIDAGNVGRAFLFGGILAAAFCGLFFVFRLYHSLWRYSGLSEALRILAAIMVGVVVCTVVSSLFGIQVQLSMLLLFSLLMGLLLCVSRFGYRSIRFLRGRHVSEGADVQRVLIVGAGSGAHIAISQIYNSAVRKYKTILAVDDDPGKQRMRIQNVEVVGMLQDIPQVVEKHDITDIVIAIPSIRDQARMNLVEQCKRTGCRVRTLPFIQETDLATPQNMLKLREVQVNDIMFRSEIELNNESVREYMRDKRVLVTGGGGSIGSEICRQVARLPIESLTIFDIYENTAYELLCELKQELGEDVNIMVRIGTIREESRLRQVFEAARPHIVFHAAAHKHVPLMEESPMEAIKNNVLGTRNVLLVAEEFGVERFVNLSTDKAVNPTNIMGATKRVTELMIQRYAKNMRMKCMSVRFGNVLGSHGSVIPLIERQIKQGGPVTVTHPEIVRFFMTIQEASQLVLQAGAMANSGAIYVLDMGTPVRIMELAEKIIRFHGYVPGEDMEIKITGLRPGEKLFEELTMKDEAKGLEKTMNNRIFKLAPVEDERTDFGASLEEMTRCAIRNDGKAIELLKHLVPGYQPWKS